MSSTDQDLHTDHGWENGRLILASLAPRNRGDVRGRPFVPSSVCTVDQVPGAFTITALGAP